MAAASSTKESPNTGAALVFAVVSGLALAMSMSGGNGVAGGVIFFAALAGVIFSTRYTARTYGRLAEREFRGADTFRWVMLAFALVVNGIMCLMVAGSAVLILGVFLTGRGVVG